MAWRRNPPEDTDAIVRDRRTGRVVGELDARQGLTVDAELRGLPWSEVERRYHVVPRDVHALMASADRALREYVASPAGQRDADRKRVEALLSWVPPAP